MGSHIFKDGVCTICGYEKHEHIPNAWEPDEGFHVTTCQKCGMTITADHEWNADGQCDLCGAWADGQLHYSLTYVLDGGVNGNNPAHYVQGDVFDLEAPERSGYVFLGWFTGAGFREQITKISADTTGDLTLYAKWEVEKQGVTYILDGGMNSSKNPVFLLPGDPAVTLSDPSRAGYEFLGWFRDSSDEPVTQLLAEDAIGGITLTACWSPIPYCITYQNIPSGTVNENPGTYTMEDALTYSQPIREGYVFGGWYSDAKLQVEVTGIALGTTGNITVYAKWTADAYTIHFDANCPTATGSMKDLATQSGKTVTLTANAFKNPGYLFLGWNTQRDGSGQSFLNKGNAAGSADVTLYAQWSKSGGAYTIRFDGNGAQAGTMSDKATAYGKAVTLAANAFKRTGYTFAGWNTAPDGTGISYANKAQVKNICLTWDENSNDNSVTLYAQWKLVTYKLTYSLGGGKKAENPASYTVEDAAITLAEPTRNYYSFAGWFTTKNFAARTQVTQIDTGLAKAVTLYAKWVKDTYTVHYDGNGATGGTMADGTFQTGVAKALAKNTFVREGYVFTGWMAESGSSYANSAKVKDLGEKDATVVLTAQWTPSTYHIRFHSNGGSGSMTLVSNAKYSAAVTLPANKYVRDGYVFAGWNTSPDGTGKSYANKAKVKGLLADDGGIVTLYAQWRAAQYTLVYSGNGGTGEMGSQTIGYNKSVKLTANKFQRTGYTFAGWNTAPDGTGKAYKNAAAIKNMIPDSQQTITLYAQWKAVGYKITYTLNSGKNAPGNPTVYYVNSDTLVLAEPTRTGYTFCGWYTTKGFTAGTAATQISAGSTGAKTFYAKWTVNHYSIAFDANGGTGAMADMEGIAYTSAKKLTANSLTRAGYTFVKWNTRPDGCGKGYSNKAEVKALTAQDGGRVVLYAQWKLVTYKITYVLNGGKNAAGSPTSYTVTSDSISLPTPTRKGYTFGGWYTTKGCTDGSQISQINPGSTGSLTLYAKWVKNS